MTAGPERRLRLFHARNACSLATVMVLNEADAAFELEIVDLSSDRAAYRRLVPSGRVPAFCIGDELLVESPAILLRIAGLFPKAELAPTDPAALSQTLSFLCWCASSVHIARRRLKRPYHFTADPTAQAAVSRDALPVVLDNLGKLDARVARGEWMAGDRFSVADAYALVFYGWALLDRIDLEPMPHLNRWAARVAARPAVRAALLADRSPILADTASLATTGSR